MAGFERVYTDQQREAMAEAFEDRRVRPAGRVVALAAAGELTLRGEVLEPFTAQEATVRHEARKLRGRRAGARTSQLAQQPPRDAIEALRRRLVNMADGELGALELQKDGQRDPEKIRQVARAVREIAALPGPGDAPPPKPGAKTQGQQHGGQTRGGLAGAILDDHRASTSGPTTAAEDETAPSPPPLTQDDGDSNGMDTGSLAHRLDDSDQTTEPGALVRELAASQGVELPAV